MVLATSSTHLPPFWPSLLPRWRWLALPTLSFKNPLQKPTGDVTDTTSIFFLQSMLKLQSGTNNMQYLTAARCWQSTRCVYASRASLTKHLKLAWERNYKTAPMEGDIFVGDLLTMCKLKNTDATSNLHIDQRNIPSAAQISVVANKE